ncbi:MAG: mRNA surveillance protein pelota [Candidatus Aenigmatarchaeota archaeon]|nr:MAG: mRNA surveillance protein pelota [Candidatus Aenigmarchaeota archaeon]
MKILKKDLKHGTVKVKIENPDDLWTLEKVLEKGDLVSGKTMRRKVIRRGEREERGEKVPVFLKIRVEDFGFQEDTGKLRIKGLVIEGPDDVSIGSYHTFVGEEGAVLNIEKEWKKWQLSELQKSIREPPRVLVCTIDDEEAHIFLITNRIEKVGEVRSGRSGKMYESGKSDYLGKVASIIKGYEGRVDGVVIAGPGFVKDELKRVLNMDVMIESCSHTGVPGLKEVINRGAVERVGKESRVVEETKKVEEAFEEIGKGSGLVEYGLEEVKRVAEQGAVKTLLVSEPMIRDFEELMNKVEEMGGKVFIISDSHEAGEKLKRIGGVMALLRYKV